MPEFWRKRGVRLGLTDKITHSHIATRRRNVVLHNFISTHSITAVQSRRAPGVTAASPSVSPAIELISAHGLHRLSPAQPQHPIIQRPCMWHPVRCGNAAPESRNRDCSQSKTPRYLRYLYLLPKATIIEVLVIPTSINCYIALVVTRNPSSSLRPSSYYQSYN